MTRATEKIIRKYAKAIGMNAKLCIRVFLRGDPKQQEIDLVGIRATIWLKEQREKGKFKVTKKGKVSKNTTDKLIQQFIKEEYGGLKNMPEFFSKPLQVQFENELFEKPKNQIKEGDMVIEEKALPYLNKKK